jgi:hypothetical protein
MEQFQNRTDHTDGTVLKQNRPYWWNSSKTKQTILMEQFQNKTDHTDGTIPRFHHKQCWTTSNITKNSIRDRYKPISKSTKTLDPLLFLEMGLYRSRIEFLVMFEVVQQIEFLVMFEVVQHCLWWKRPTKVMN